MTWAWKTPRSLVVAEEAAAKGEKVVWAHPKGYPPPEWVAKRLKAAGVRIWEVGGKDDRRPTKHAAISVIDELEEP